MTSVTKMTSRQLGLGPPSSGDLSIGGSIRFHHPAPLQVANLTGYQVLSDFSSRDIVVERRNLFQKSASECVKKLAQHIEMGDEIVLVADGMLLEPTLPIRLQLCSRVDVSGSASPMRRQVGIFV
jgi:hypothetical protein